jgi:hypothetical protein
VFPDLKIEHLLSILIGLIVGSFLNLSVKIRSIGKKLGQINSNEIVHRYDLNEAIRKAFERNRRVNELRIFAISTGMIQPIIRSSNNVQIKKCIVLLREFDEREASQNIDFKNEIESIIKKWYVLKNEGKILELEILRYRFHPTEYNCIFDKETLICGLYAPLQEDDSKVRVLEPLLITNDTSQGKSIINDFHQRFEDLRASLL